MASNELGACRGARGFQAIVLPSVGNMVFVSLLFVLAVTSAQGLLGDGDTAYHIQTGEIILQTLQVPTYDPYSFHNPPLRWTAHEWLSEVIMAMLFRASGLTGVVIFFAVLLSLTHWLLFQSLRLRFNDIFLCVVITLIATASSSIHWLARPHAFSLLFVVIWCHYLDQFQHTSRNNALPYLPLLMVIWVNLHGGFIIGLLLLTVYLTGNIFYALVSPRIKANNHVRKAKILLIVLVSTVGACLLNPSGIDILWFPIRVAADRFIADQVIEFLSPNFHEALPFKYMLLATIGALALSRSALNLIDAILLVLLCYMALYSARHISLFAIVIAPILLKSLQDVLLQVPDRFLRFYHERVDNFLRIDRNVNGYLWPIVSIAAIFVLAGVGAINYGFSVRNFPVAAVEFLKKEPITGNMFNSDEFGDYIIFAAWPKYRVFMDGRSDMYGEKFGRDYLRAAHGLPGWKEVFEKYSISWVMFDTNSPLTAALQDHRDWQPIYTDAVATIFVKRIAAHSALLQKYPTVSLAKQ
jgi:hypothetical protein